MPSGASGKRVVLHIGPASSKGGMGSVICRLAANPPNGWRAQVLASHSDGGVAKVLQAWRAARKACAKLDPNTIDVAHVHSASRWSWTRKSGLIRILRNKGIPVVLSFHSGDFDSFAARKSGKKGRQMVNICADEGVIPVVLTENWQRRLAAWLGDDWRVVGNPAPTISTANTPTDASLRTRNSFLFMGRSNPMKGQEIAIEAMRILQQRGVDATLTICGITQQNHLMKNAPNNVKAVGWVEDEQRNSLFKSSGCLLLPSKWEGLSVVVLEAMAYGLPVLASQASSGVFTDAGRIIDSLSPEDWADAMQETIANQDAWSAMAAIGPAEVKPYNIETIQQQWGRIYSEAIGGREA